MLAYLKNWEPLPLGSFTSEKCQAHREGKPAALMRMVSRTPQALSCCTALFSSNLRIRMKIINTQRNLARATNFRRLNSSVKSQMNKLEKKVFKGWDSDQNGKLHGRVGRRQLAVKIKNHKYYLLFIPQIYKKWHWAYFQKLKFPLYFAHTLHGLASLAILIIL